MGGGTSSYREVEESDLIILWGSNARATHPIFFHHVLKAIRRGCRLVVIDPRRTETAQWADRWLGVEVGSDIALANGIAGEILRQGLENRSFITNATENFDDYREQMLSFPLEQAAAITGIPGEQITELARAYACADRAMICWTLGITEHHTAVDNVLALCNLALLTGHVGRHGSGLNPLRGQNNVQGGGDMGAIPNRLPGFQDIETDPEARRRLGRHWGCEIPTHYGKTLTQMFEAMEMGELDTLYVIGENPAQSEADIGRVRRLLGGLKLLVVQDIHLTATAQLADVVLPGSASWCESDGTVTNSERRVQRVRRALDPPGQAREDCWIVQELARRLGREWGFGSAEQIWDALRADSPLHAGMSYGRIASSGGLQWPCLDIDDPGTETLHTRLWQWPLVGPRVGFHPTVWQPPAEPVDADYPLLLTTGRRLAEYNTGTQTGGYHSPLHGEEALRLSPEDMAHYRLSDGERVCVSSRRGAVEAPVICDESLRPGLVFLTLHRAHEVDTNLLTIDAVDPVTGTAEFKACAIRIDTLAPSGR